MNIKAVGLIVAHAGTEYMLSVKNEQTLESHWNHP